MKSVVSRILAAVLVCSLAANVLLYLRWSNSRPLVTVGGEVITKKEFQDHLEYQSGASVLNTLVFTRLVTQAAAREGVAPTQKDVDARIAMIQRRAPNLLAPYSSDKVKMAEFRQSLGTEIALENLRIKDVSLTPAELAAYYAAHRQQFLLPPQMKTTTVVTQNSVDAATATDLLRQNTPPDAIARQPHLMVVGIGSYKPDLEQLSPALKAQVSAFVQSSKVGAIKTFRDGAYFLTFQVTNITPGQMPTLSQVRDEVDRMARLERAPAPQATLAKLYQASTPVFNSDRYAAYFEPFQNYRPEKGQKTAAKKTAFVP